MHLNDRDLGMMRPISRRDFLNGVGVALTGAALAPPWLGAYRLSAADQPPEQPEDYYPPLRTGMRGSHPGSFEVGHQLRDRRAWTTLRRNRIGIVFQEFLLLPTLTAIENVEIAMSGTGLAASRCAPAAGSAPGDCSRR